MTSRPAASRDTPSHPSATPARDPLAVLAGLTLGTRVVVRHLIEEGERATDAVGELEARGEDSVTVATRRGQVSIPLADVVLAKPVPAPGAGTGWRIPPFLRRAGVAVLDLDGVLRTFDTSGELAELERDLGLGEQGLLEVAFALPVAREMLHGRARYADWSAALQQRLVDDGHPEALAAQIVTTWTGDHGSVVAPTAALVEELRAAGTPTFIFTNGTDRVPAELERLGLGHLLPHLLNACEFGVVKPDPGAYAAAHAEIEARLDRRVGVAEVHFVDDRPANVDAARAFGWQGRVFTLPAGS